jgi:hypothetical protein
MKIKAKKEIHDHVLDEFDHQHIKANRIYEVIGISCDHYRVINDIGEPVLYPNYLFEVIDDSLPKSWVKSEFTDGEYYIDPPELCGQGFYEDYFDGVPEAKAIFEKFKRNLGKGQL